MGFMYLEEVQGGSMRRILMKSMRRQKTFFEKRQGKNRKRKTKGDISVEKIQNWIWGSPNIMLKWS